jgi:predicted acetyltransferase
MNLSGITVRLAQADDLAQVVNLDRLAFAPLSSAAEIEREWYNGTLDVPDRAVFLAVEDQTGQSVGSYVQLNLDIWFQGQQFPAMGIAAVAVAPHRRGRQVARQMLTHALESGRSQQVPILALYPFQHGFYRQLGWAWVGQVHQYRVATRNLPIYPDRLKILPFDSAQQTDGLKAAYAQAATQHNGWLQRRDRQWEQILQPKPGREVYCYSEAGQLLGYVILQFIHLEAQNPRLAIGVQEWVALNAAAYRGILGFLGSLRDQFSTIVWNTFANDPFPHLLREQQTDMSLHEPSFGFGLVHRFGAIGGGWMWRLVDLHRAFGLRSIQPVEPFALTFRVIDPRFGEQTIGVEFAAAQMHCSAKPAGSIVTLSVEQLTALFCGMRHAIDLYWTGELELDGDPALLNHLDRAWQATPPFCWDFF